MQVARSKESKGAFPFVFPFVCHSPGSRPGWGAEPEKGRGGRGGEGEKETAGESTKEGREGKVSTRVKRGRSSSWGAWLRHKPWLLASRGFPRPVPHCTPASSYPGLENFTLSKFREISCMGHRKTRWIVLSASNEFYQQPLLSHYSHVIRSGDPTADQSSRTAYPDGTPVVHTQVCAAVTAIMGDPPSAASAPPCPEALSGLGRFIRPALECGQAGVRQTVKAVCGSLSWRRPEAGRHRGGHTLSLHPLVFGPPVWGLSPAGLGRG